jgi:hypothetical protein
MQNFYIDEKSWTVLSRALDEVLDLPPEERTAWLAGLAPEYADLKLRLLELLHRTSSSSHQPGTIPKLDIGHTETSEASSP